MSWLKTTAGELLAGEDAKALGTFLDVFGKLVDDGVPPSEALEQVRRKSEEAVRRIAEHYLGDTAGQLADEVQRLRKPLWNFEEAPGEKDRQFGWPQKAASKDASGEGYSFTLAAEAGPPPRLDRPTFQFQRTGFFCVDSDSTKKKPVFNRVVALREDKEK